MADLSTSQVLGDLTVSGLTKSSILQSLIGTGTAPLIVASTTKVDNLNADLLDGYHGTAVATANMYALRGGTIANIQVAGLSSSWGVTDATNTGGINVVMGTANATWAISGTSVGVFRGGLQIFNNGLNVRLYATSGYLDISSAGLVTSSGGFSGALTGNATTATTFQTARTIAVSGDGTGTATSFNGSANITIPFTLATVATAGTYRSVTINAKGLVTAGTNPTTLSGYGITDAVPLTHVGASGSEHAAVTTTVNGFMSYSDKVNLDAVPKLAQGLRNSFLADGGAMSWGVTANVFSWSKQINIYPAQGTLLLNGLPFKKLIIAASSVTLPSAGYAAYITVPTAYSDAINLIGTCTMAVADATTVAGVDKIILYVRDGDNCLQAWDGWIPYGTTVQAGGKRDTYLYSATFTAANDFVVGNGVGLYVKKTLAETRAILGTNANTASTLVLRDASGNFTAGTITAALTGNATSATNLAGGSVGLIPYQSAAATTVFLAAGTAGQFLKSNGAAAPSWGFLDLETNAPDLSYKKICRVATAADLGASTFASNVLTGYTNAQSLACTTTAASTSVTTTSTAGLKVGAVISVATTAIAAGTVVAGITSATVFTVTNRTAITTTAITSDGTTATATFAAQTYVPYAVGSTIVISGTTPTTYSGSFVVTACTTTTVSWASTETVTATIQGAINFTIAAGTSVTTSFAQTTAALVIDGITMAVGDRVLVKDTTTLGSLTVSTNMAYNGIYKVTAIGSASVAWALTRSGDADLASDLDSAMVKVSVGTVNGGKTYQTYFKSTDTLNTTALTWNRVADVNASAFIPVPTTAVGVDLSTNTETVKLNTGALADLAIISLGVKTITSLAASTYTRASTLYIAGAPVASTNATITTPYAIYVASGNSYLAGNLTNGGTLTNTGAVTLSSTLAVTGNTTLTGDIAVNGGYITSTATTFNLLTGTVTTLNAFGSVTSLILANQTNTSSFNMFGGATISGATKTVYLGTSGLAGSTTNIYLGSASGTSTIALQGSVTTTSTITASGAVYTPNLQLQKVTNAMASINWYSPTYNSWQDYMANAGTSTNGSLGNITAPVGSYVTAYGLRSVVPNVTGYGWTWESCADNTAAAVTPTIIAELSSYTGNFRTIGSGSFGGTLTIAPTNVSGVQTGISLIDAGGGAREGLSLSWSNANYSNFASIFGTSNTDATSGTISLAINGAVKLAVVPTGITVYGGISATGASTLYSTLNVTGLITGSASLTITGTIYASGNITAYSDSRLKEVISIIESPIEKLQKLTGYVYKRKDLGFKTEIGLLAQDVESVMPELITELKIDPTLLIPDGIVKTLDYSKLTAFLIEVCKEQQNRIEELEKKVM